MVESSERDALPTRVQTHVASRSKGVQELLDFSDQIQELQPPLEAYNISEEAHRRFCGPTEFCS